MRLRTFVLVVTTALTAGPAFAETSAADHERAAAAFESGRMLLVAGDCVHAIQLFEESLRYERSVGAHLSLAECLEKSDPLSAWSQLKEAELLAAARRDDRAGEAHRRAAALEANLATMSIVVPAATLGLAGLEVRIDGRAIDRFFYYQGDATAVEPGKHTVEVSAPGKKTMSKPLVAAIGRTATIAVVLDDVEPSPLSGPAPSSSTAGQAPKRTAGLIVAGAGLVSLGVATYFGLRALSFKGERDALCTPDALCTSQDAFHYDHLARIEQVRSIIFASIGVAAVGAGAWLALSAAGSAKTSARLVPRVGGLSVEGTW